MLSYDMQLELKRDVIVRAYAAHSSTFSLLSKESFSTNHLIELSPSSIPEIQPTHPSPLEYGYRTKITPHFELKNEPFTNGVKPDWLKIGFNKINTRRAMDIEVQHQIEHINVLTRNAHLCRNAPLQRPL